MQAQCLVWRMVWQVPVVNSIISYTFYCRPATTLEFTTKCNVVEKYVMKGLKIRILFGAFPKWRKATNSFVTFVSLTVRVSVLPHKTIRLPFDGFYSNFILETSTQIYRENSIIFIVAPCILKIHWVLHTNECTNCILYISLKLITLKHLKCCYMFRSLDHPQGARIFPC
jgi:hypothetical protein